MHAYGPATAITWLLTPTPPVPIGTLSSLVAFSDSREMVIYSPIALVLFAYRTCTIFSEKFQSQTINIKLFERPLTAHSHETTTSSLTNKYPRKKNHKHTRKKVDSFRVEASAFVATAAQRL